MGRTQSSITELITCKKSLISNKALRVSRNILVSYHNCNYMSIYLLDTNCSTPIRSLELYDQFRTQSGYLVMVTAYISCHDVVRHRTGSVLEKTPEMIEDSSSPQLKKKTVKIPC